MMLNIVVPMAGRGSRFANAGYKDPKPLIPVGGKPMIQWVIDNVRPALAHRFIFVCLAEHLTNYPEVPATLRRLCPGCEIVTVDRVTEGAACTVLLARKFIDNDNPLMIANADQFVELKIDSYLAEMEKQKADGLIMTFWADHPKWSYCRMNVDGSVLEVVEKKVISNEATAGIYNFRRGADYVRAADAMIAKNLRVNNEFYVAPTYNGIFGLGEPEDLDFFKTTEHYAAGWVGGVEPVATGAALTERLSVLYARFFNDRNIAGLTAMLDEDFALEDPAVRRLEGKRAVLDYIRKVYQQNDKLKFVLRTVTATEKRSVIEFVLVLGDQRLCGTDVLEWSGCQLRELRAYLTLS